MKYCCYGLLALLSCSVSAMPEPEFAQLRGPLFKGAAANYSQAVLDTDKLLQQHQLKLTLEQQIRLNYHKAIFQDRSNQTETALQTLALLSKVLSALLDNALQHAEPPSGPLQIKVRLASQQTTSGEALWLLYFSDNGAGIEPDLRDKIFDPFFTTKLGQGNLGLGLNIAYNQLQLMGGNLEYLPEQLGCCFLIRLPAPV